MCDYFLRKWHDSCRECLTQHFPHHDASGDRDVEAVLRAVLRNLDDHIGGIYDFLEKFLPGKATPSITPAKPTSTASKPSASASKLAAVQSPASSSSSSSQSATSQPSSSSLSFAELKERNKAIKRAEKAVTEAESKISKLESDIAALEAKLATPEGAADNSLFTKYGELKQQLSDAEDEWTMLSMELDELKAQ